MKMDYSSYIINNLTDIKDREVINICLINGCSIFGGYIRDIISGVSPNDIDVLVPTKYFNNLIEELSILGHKFEGDIDDIYEPNIICCKHKSLRELDLHLCENLEYLSSWLSPNINCLAICFDKQKSLIMYNWYIARDENFDDPNLIVYRSSDIIKNIINREMKIIYEDINKDINKDKILKYENKGYKILR